MDELFKKVLMIAGYLFGALLIVFTSIQTYSLIYSVSGNHLTAAVGLILFEVGMIYWWSVFRREAVGLFQMAISGLMFVISLAYVATAVALHLGAVDPTFLGQATPARIINLAALLNLIAKLTYPLVDPDVFTQVTDRAHEGKILNQTYKKFSTKIDDISDELSDEMAEEWKDRTRRQIRTSWSGSLNRRQLESNNSSNAPRHDSTAELPVQTSAAAGQGGMPSANGHGGPGNFH